MTGTNGLGNAQKLVNMVAKYMYIATYNDESKRQLFNECHCPMDGRMIDCVNKMHSGKKIEGGWSTMEYENGSIPQKYEMFQSRVRELVGYGVPLVVFDYENWRW